MQLKNAYVIAELRKSGYSKTKFYTEAAKLCKAIRVDKDDLSKVFIQLTLEFLSKQLLLHPKAADPWNTEAADPLLSENVAIFENVLDSRRGHTRGIGLKPCSSTSRVVSGEESQTPQFSKALFQSWFQNPDFRDELQNFLSSSYPKMLMVKKRMMAATMTRI